MNNKIPYNNHRKLWLSDEYLGDMFEGNIDGIDNFKYQLSNIPVSEKYTIIGYGSLLNQNNALFTLDTIFNFKRGLLTGFTRTFNVGMRQSILNVEKSIDPKSTMAVSLIEIPFYELPELINREAWYNFHQINTGETTTGLIVSAKKQATNERVEPQLNYLHLCLSGLNEFYPQGVDNFLDETMCFSYELKKRVSARVFLNNLKLTNYILRNEYKNR